jgi:hypothetical protein
MTKIKVLACILLAVAAVIVPVMLADRAGVVLMEQGCTEDSNAASSSD